MHRPSGTESVPWRQPVSLRSASAAETVAGRRSTTLALRTMLGLLGCAGTIASDALRRTSPCRSESLSGGASGIIDLHAEFPGDWRRDGVRSIQVAQARHR